jgi:addiction module RelB/DinJ family antitoxin
VLTTATHWDITVLEDKTMAESRLSIRIDDKTKRKADAVFRKLGLNMSTGITIYLNQVAQQQGIPFPLTLEKEALNQKASNIENSAAKAANTSIGETKARGLPVAHYDVKRKRPYLEYPDGRKEYNLGE